MGVLISFLVAVIKRLRKKQFKDINVYINYTSKIAKQKIIESVKTYYIYLHTCVNFFFILILFFESVFHCFAWAGL